MNALFSVYFWNPGRSFRVSQCDTQGKHSWKNSWVRSSPALRREQPVWCCSSNLRESACYCYYSCCSLSDSTLSNHSTTLLSPLLLLLSPAAPPPPLPPPPLTLYKRTVPAPKKIGLLLSSPRTDPCAIQSRGPNNAAAAALKGAQEQFSAGNNAAQLSPWKLMTARWREGGTRQKRGRRRGRGE